MIYKKITVFTKELDRASAHFLMLGAAGTELITSTGEDLRCFQFDYLDFTEPEYSGVAACFEVSSSAAEVASFDAGIDSIAAEVNSSDVGIGSIGAEINPSDMEEVLTDSGKHIPLTELLRSLEEVGFGDYKVEELNSADWENEWKKYLKLSYLSKFTIIPLVEEDAPVNRISVSDHAYADGKSGDPIYIIPGRAFGTGLHETTQLCVELLTKYVKPGGRIADIGTGSGILAIAAKKLGAAEVVAIDNDEGAIENATLNAELNSVELHLHLGHLANDLDGTMDVVVANIIVKAVIELADKAKELLKKEQQDGEGIYICSGIIQEEKANVISALKAKGYRILEVMEMGEWCAVAASPK